MRNTIRFIVPLLLLALFVAGSAAADTRYVTDQLIITLRQGMGNQYKILKTLHTGAPLQVLGEQGKYLEVQTEDGTQGYVLKQYVTSEIPKPLIIARQKKELDQLRQQVVQLQQNQSSSAAKAHSLQSQAGDLQDSLDKAQQQLKTVTTQYNDLRQKAQNVVQLANERDRLSTKNKELVTQVATLSKENQQMLHTGMIRWFLAGAGVFFGGWILGKVSRRKKRGF